MATAAQAQLSGVLVFLLSEGVWEHLRTVAIGKYAELSLHVGASSHRGVLL